MLKKPYRAPNGHWYTVALFKEVRERFNRTNSENLIEDFEPIFSLHSDIKGYINVKRTFVELGDPTGYKWAMKYLGDYSHWERLCKAPWFQEALDIWTNELNMKLKSDAMDRIREIAKSDNESQALAANKFIATGEYDKPRAGRPSKETLRGELKKATQILDTEKEDMQRMGLRVVK